MKRRLSSQDSEERWKILLQSPHLTPTFHKTVSNSNKEEGDDDHDDPFDCRSVALPPTHDLVEGVLQEYKQRWAQLDDRRVVQDSSLKQQQTNDDNDILTTVNVDENDDSTVPGKRHRANDDDDEDEEDDNRVLEVRKAPHKGGWRFADGRLRVPNQFDYATKRSEPPEDDDDDDGGDRVISLLDPSLTLSYHQELWKLFASVPKAEELEHEARSGARLDQTLKVYNEIIEGNKQSSRLDGHSLSRLRMSDRHGLSPPPTSVSSQQGGTLIPNVAVATIRLECWRRQPRRGTSPDCDRIGLEFLASQTLLDVHNTIVKMTEDDLWNSSSTTTTTATSTTPEEVANDQAGCFFIDDAFYTTGSVDYAGPIRTWIDGGGRPNPARRGYLGIGVSKTNTNHPLQEKSMRETALNQVPFQLGFRYYHVCHGDVETAIMVVDRRLLASSGKVSSSSSSLYPLIHDVWTPSYPTPTCDACRHYPAMYVTSASCDSTDGGPRMLCEGCCTQLRLPPASVTLHSIWRNQSDLSTGTTQDHCRYF